MEEQMTPAGLIQMANFVVGYFSQEIHAWEKSGREDPIMRAMVDGLRWLADAGPDEIEVYSVHTNLCGH